MNLVGQPERATQDRIIALFRDELGYRYLGDWTSIAMITAIWYREQLKEAVPPLLARWQSLLGIRVERFFVQRMKTKWGSCNHKAGTIRLNTELAKKPPECLEYIVLHELVHLLEPTHNARFVAIMDRFMPQWQFHRQALNRLPVRHEKWSY